MLRSLKIIGLFFITLLLNINKNYSQEALRIFDLRKKNKTFSLAELNDLDLKKTGIPTKQLIKQEKSASYFGPIFTVDFTKDDKYILAGGTDGSVQIWNVISGNMFKRVECHQGKVLGAKFFIGTKFFSASDDGEIYLFNGSNGKKEKHFLQEDAVNQAISFQAFNKAAEGDEKIATRKEIKEKAEPGMEKRLAYNTSLDFSSDKKILAVGADNAVITIFNIATAEPIKYLRGHKKRINCLAFKPTKHEIISGSDDNNIIIWKWESQTDKPKILKGHTGGITALAFPKGIRTVMASGSKDNTIRVWNMIKDSCTKILEGHEAEITSLAFTNNGKYLVSGSRDNTIRIWDIANERMIKMYSIFEYPVQSVAISNNENFILSGGFVFNGSGALRLWQLKAIIKEYETHL